MQTIPGEGGIIDIVSRKHHEKNPPRGQCQPSTEAIMTGFLVVAGSVTYCSPKPQNPVVLIIKSAVFWLEEGVGEWFGSEEGFGEVVVVLRCPVVSLSLFP